GGGAQAWTYSYSTTPNRRWHEARQWCHQHLSNMVTIQTPEETDFINNLLPFNQKYYWTGIRKVDGVWTREGNNKTVPEDAQNWAPEEPDKIAGQDCVEIYIKRNKDTAKWNNEKCQSKKGTICYSGKPLLILFLFHWFSESNTKLFTALMSNGVSSSSVVQCNSLEAPPHASVECQDPLEVYSYGSICTVQCEEGFDLIGANMTQCSSQGSWSHTLPVCQAKKCNPINPPPHGSLSCSDPHGSFSFGSHCMTTCDEGFLLNGTANAECTSLGMWTKRCPALNSTTYGSLFCFDPHGEFSFGSQCTSACEEGFLLNGTADTVCTSLGTWSADIPHCLAKRCPTLNSPPHGSFSCYDPHGEFSFGSRCTSTCEEGFVLNGTANTDCTSVGKWSRDVPRCLAKRCPTLNSPPHGSSSCSDPHVEFSFGSRCTSACEEGFVLSGMADTECTSVGTWSTETPHCLAKKCPSLNSPPHGSSSCSDPHGEFRFGSRCTSACEEGFVLNGTADTELKCLNISVPLCLCFSPAKKCPTLNPLAHGTFLCSDPHGEFSFGSRCTSTCEEGFVLNGTADTECTSLGTWSTETPRCLGKRKSHNLLIVIIIRAFNFRIRELASCNKSKYEHATEKLTSLTSQNLLSPLSRPCPLLAEAPQHGRMNCSHPFSPFSYNSSCGFECNEGFWLRGTPTMTCSNSGHWSQDLPTCQPVQCEDIPASSLPLSMNCSHPLGHFSFGSQCLFTCTGGFSLNGTEVLLCSSAGFWSDSLPNCTGKASTPVGAAMLMNSATGATSVLVPLLLIGLGFLALFILTRSKKRGESLSNDGVQFHTYTYTML
uniref:Selectin P n=1 Tax=Seriola lalandi dorsalis TaxID=1841481 RepID=A0A3B4XYC1_SERLL